MTLQPAVSLLCALTALMIGAMPVTAEEQQQRPQSPKRPPPTTGWSVDLGGAVLFNPEFQGSDRYRVLPVPYIDARYQDAKGTLLFASVNQGIGGYLLRRGTVQNRFTISAAIAPGFASRDPDSIDGINTFGPGVEAQVGLAYQTGKVSLEAKLAQALGTGHEGFYADVAYNIRGRVGQRGFYSFGPSLRYGAASYITALYNLSSVESEESGLAGYSAGPGFESVGLGGVVSVPAFGAWRLTGVARYSRLLEDAKDSSLTETPNQAFFLVALTRRL